MHTPRLAGTIILASLVPLTAGAQARDGTSASELKQRLDTQAERIERLERDRYQGRKHSPGESRVQVSGFINAGFQSTNLGPNGPMYRDTDHEVRATNFTEAGVQIDGQVTDRVAGTVQLLGLGTEGFDAETEWAYLSYETTPNLKFRAGRLVLPFYMNSQSFYVGYAHPWIEPPAEVYDTAPLRSFEGADVSWQFNTGGIVHALNYFLGSSDVDSGYDNGTTGADIFYAVHNLHGLNLSSSVGNLETWLAYSNGDVDLNLSGVTNTFAPYALENDDAYFGSAGFEYDNGDIMVIAEHVELDIKSDWFPKSRSHYVTLGYHVNSWTPHLTWANSESTSFDRIEGDVVGEFLYNGVKTHQKSWTLGLRKDVAPGLAIKAEVSTYYDIGSAEDGNDQPGTTTAGSPAPTARQDDDSGLFSALPGNEDDPMVFRLGANLAF